MNAIDRNVSAETHKFTTRTSSASPANEGSLVAPPRLVQEHWRENNEREEFWRASSPVSDPKHELETLRTAWREMAELLANRALVETPEVFEMPPAMTRRVRACVRNIGLAPFVFVDEYADDGE